MAIIAKHDLHNVPTGLYSLKDIPDVPVKQVIECMYENEYGDAKLFSFLFDGVVVRDHSASKWYIWEGHYWAADRTKQLRHLVCGVLAAVYDRAAVDLNLKLSRLANIGDLTVQLDREQTEQEKQENARRERMSQDVKGLHARAKLLKNFDRQKKVLELAESFLGITGDQWDKNPWVLGTADGVIDLKCGAMRPGRAEEYIRTIISAEWKGLQAECPRFLQFLHQIFEDRPEEEREQIIGFLQRMLGYGLTGLVSEHKFLVLYGAKGRNGKDTLMTLLNSIIGEMAQPIPNEVMLSSKTPASAGSAKPHLLDLQGKRFAWANEPEEGSRFDIGQVKDLTGGGLVSGRPLYHNETIRFSPSHLLLLLTNHKPHADPQDSAFWDRMCPIIFNLRFVDKPQADNERLKDITLGEKLEAEKSGVLAWLVRGCLEWQKNGLQIPDCILKAREEYRMDEDLISLFISAECVIHNLCEVGAGELYKAYKEWCIDNSMKPMSGVAFGKRIKEAFKAPRMTKGVVYLGIGLKDAYPSLKDETAEGDAAEISPEHMAMFEEAKGYLEVIREKWHTGTPVFQYVDSNGQEHTLGIDDTIAKFTEAMTNDPQWFIDSVESSLPVWKEAVS